MVFDLGAAHPAAQSCLWTWGANPREHGSPEQHLCVAGSWDCTVGQGTLGACGRHRAAEGLPAGDQFSHL